MRCRPLPTLARPLLPRPRSQYMGKGVLTAVKNVNEVIAPALVGMDPTKQVREAPPPHRLEAASSRLDLPAAFHPAAHPLPVPLFWGDLEAG